MSKPVIVGILAALYIVLLFWVGGWDFERGPLAALALWVSGGAGVIGFMATKAMGECL